MTTHYDRIGGVEKVRALVTRFYQLMDELPESYGIRQLHPGNLRDSEDKLFKYLCGWMGGPALYVQEYGHPMLRRRHLPFPIGESERDQWLLCMNWALREEVENADLRRELSSAFAKVADHMQNKQGPV
ncbi:group II truncated hemoglobin [Glaciimonas sp. CA11.2]|uniref:group II truncated hemoglobin n=1 Tax=unclassified Glaciimonas TaxID=2644401 RepID=UPI002AB5C80D|nr:MULTISPECIES: group II truncated hemoglobin [unclassified Glaciimonas]MDY7549101.1 group II truncated hemoglobin [Glaciimonas sp. CA11.2]MEB0013108.1 group II truncated hemoglobin [Glaciimonas sp. Cout2]MEB0082009.1 group II truncated hemoglobin [Glaciimonas sp. Gout2]MEB0161838.1 group II truncated hemoglobin [Glaciimonas sp. CA11.2]